MKLSIITINYNNRDGLQKTLDSVISQTCQDFEWIIIDGGSTDGSRVLIEQNATRLAYWVSEPDRGIYHAMNKGIRASHGEYLLFLNSGDCLYKSDVVERVIPLLGGKDFYVGDELLSNGNIVRTDVSDIHKLLIQVVGFGLPHQSTFCHCQVFDKYGLYREDLKIISDWWLFFTAIGLGEATYERLPFIISVFDMHGVSSQSDLCRRERKSKIIQERPVVSRLWRFYHDNYEIIEVLRSNKFVFFLFRIYFWFYRKVRK